jgi:hypothetical protein
MSISKLRPSQLSDALNTGDQTQRTFVSGAIQVGGAGPGGVGIGLAPVCAFESGASERVGVRQKGAADPARRGIVGTVKEQVLLGGEQLLEKLRKDVRDDAKEQGAARRLAAARPTVAEAGLKDYSAVALAVKRYEERLRRNSAGERGQFERVCQLCNVEM